MTYEALVENLKQMKQIVKELYIFTNQLQIINNLEIKSKIIIKSEEKKLLTNAIISLTAQLKILNDSIPNLIEGISLYQKIKTGKVPKQKKLVEVKYKPDKIAEKVSLIISDKDKKEFLKNLSRSNLSINQLKKKFSAKKSVATFGRPNAFAKISNRFFRKKSNELIAKGYFDRLNKDLRKINSPFVLGTYVSMIMFSVVLTFFICLILLGLIMFLNISLLFPFITFAEEFFLIRFAKFFWIVIVIPIGAGLFMYFYPSSEGKNIGSKIDQELPFVAIHMSAIATSGVEPLSIFKIILRSNEYKYTNVEFRKLLNLINFHGKNLVTSLKIVANTSPSSRLRELLNGLAIAITSGGDMHSFLDQHSESLLFDYKLEREKYTKTSETFMDIYISIVIAAPMILLMLFVIMGSTGALDNFLGISTGVVSLLIILMIMGLNIGFLFFLNTQQPKM